MSIFEKYGIYLHDPENMTLGNTQNNPILSQMLTYWEDPDEIREDVLPEFEAVEKGELEEGEIGADVVGSADVGPETTYLGNSSVSYQPMTLPTADFKQLWLEWIELLEAHGRGRSG